MSDSDRLEFVCNENNRDITHLVGKASDVTGVEVAPEILARYAGVYVGTRPSGLPMHNEILYSDRELWVSRNGGARELLTPVADTRFLSPSGAQLEFVEADGEVVALRVSTIGLDVRLPRVRQGK
jgi:hypothetical protein